MLQLIISIFEYFKLKSILCILQTFNESVIEMTDYMYAGSMIYDSKSKFIFYPEQLKKLKNN